MYISVHRSICGEKYTNKNMYAKYLILHMCFFSTNVRSLKARKLLCLKPLSSSKQFKVLLILSPTHISNPALLALDLHGDE